MLFYFNGKKGVVKRAKSKAFHKPIAQRKAMYCVLSNLHKRGIPTAANTDLIKDIY